MLYDSPAEVSQWLAETRQVGDLYLQRLKYEALIEEISEKVQDRFNREVTLAGSNSRFRMKRTES